jgi:tetratricopeptide (TPR) repeat protein
MSILLDALEKLEKKSEQRRNKNAMHEIKQEKKSFLRKAFNRYLVYLILISMILIAALYLFKEYSIDKEKTNIAATPEITAPVMQEEEKIKPEEPPPLPEAKIIKHEENSSVDLYEQAMNFFEQDNPTEATQLLSEQRDTENYLSVIKKISLFLLETNRYDETIELLTPALSYYPRDIDIREYLGLANFYQANYSRTIEILLANQPVLQKNTSYYALLAASYLRTSRFEQATELYLALTKIEASNPNIFLGLAICYQYQNKLVLAQNYYRKSLEASPISWSSRGFVIEQLSIIGARIS